MTQEEKVLLLKDLCARSVYGVMCDRLGQAKKLLSVSPDKLYCIELDNGEYTPNKYKVEDAKPYLRTMSSMTEKEFLTIYDMCWPKDLEFKSSYGSYWGDFKTKKYVPNFMYNSNQLDYLTSHHFDYRGLIEKGLAIEAPEDMYKF